MGFSSIQRTTGETTGEYRVSNRIGGPHMRRHVDTGRVAVTETVENIVIWVPVVSWVSGIAISDLIKRWFCVKENKQKSNTLWNCISHEWWHYYSDLFDLLLQFWYIYILYFMLDFFFFIWQISLCTVAGTFHYTLT